MSGTAALGEAFINTHQKDGLSGINCGKIKDLEGNWVCSCRESNIMALKKHVCSQSIFFALANNRNESCECYICGHKVYREQD